MAARLALLPLLALTACDFLGQLSDPESDPQPLELVASDAFYGDGAKVAGGGASSYFAYSRWSTAAGGASVRLVRNDASNPDALEVLGDVEVPSLDFGFVDGSSAVLWVDYGLVVIDLASPELSTRTASAPSAGMDMVAVSGRWLLAGAGNTLALLDLDAAAWVGGYTTSAPLTAVLATQGVFLAFTTTGYVHVAPAAVSPVFTPVGDAVVRGFRSAFGDGAEAIVAGPALTLGRSRVVRLDLSSPAAPAVLRSHEVPAPFAFFAWDGASTSVVATGELSSGIHEGYVVHEEGGAFRSAGIPLPTWYRQPNPIAAHDGRLLALGYDGIGLYRINR